MNRIHQGRLFLAPDHPYFYCACWLLVTSQCSPLHHQNCPLHQSCCCYPIVVREPLQIAALLSCRCLHDFLIWFVFLFLKCLFYFIFLIKYIPSLVLVGAPQPQVVNLLLTRSFQHQRFQVVVQFSALRRKYGFC